jgi:Rod binding domain-containing protein
MLSITAASSVSAGQIAPQPRLVHAAHEFEAQMMQELLKPMTRGNGLDGEEGAASGSGSTLSEFASEALGKALSERGGFGIAKSIIHQLSHSGNGPVTARVTKNSSSNTVVNSLK